MSKEMRCSDCNIRRLSGRNVCDNCIALKINENYKKIRVYMSSHPKANFNDIAKETGVAPNQIWYYLREGKLNLHG